MLGFYVSGHPLEKWRGVLETQKFSRLDAIEALEESRRTKDGRGWEGPRYSFGVIVQDVEQRFSRSSGNPFAIVRIEDFTNQAEVMVIGKTYERVHEAGLLRKGAVVELSARVEHDDRTDSRRLAVLDVKELPKPKALSRKKAIRAADEMDPLPAPAELELHIAQNSTCDDLRSLHSILMRHPGATPVVLVVHRRGSEVRLQPAARFAIELSPPLIVELDPWLTESTGQ